MQLSNNEIHIWTTSLLSSSEQEASLAFLLSADEIERAMRFKFAAHKRRFIIARGVLRNILSRYIKIKPKDIIFKYNQHKKPILDLPSSKLIHFNLSHSEDVAIYAISKQTVGIDIEKIKPAYSSGLATRFFHRDECSLIESLPTERQAEAFYHLWTQKEAITKAAGKNLASSLATLALTAYNTLEAIKYDNRLWYVQPLAIANTYASALASEHTPTKLEYYDYKLW